MEKLTSIIGDGHAHHCPTLIHLVLTDSAYYDTSRGEREEEEEEVDGECVSV